MNFIHHKARIGTGSLLLVASLLLFLPLPLTAAIGAPPLFNARTWQTYEGLPNNNVQAIAQTPDGYLWIGTKEGLVRYDGVSFTAPTNLELRNSNITALCTDRTGALWIGSDGGGLVRFKDGKSLHVGKADGLAGDSVRTIYAGRDGVIWTGTPTGLSEFRNNKFTTYTRLYYTQEKSLISSIINSLCEDKDGSLWVASSGGLNRMKGRDIEEYSTPDGLPNRSLRCVVQDTNGVLWIASNSGLTKYENGEFDTFNTRQGLADNFVTSILVDREGNVWVGNYGGMNRFVDGVFVTELNYKGDTYDQINTIFEDHEGNVWAGSKEGLIQFSHRRFSVISKKQGLSYNNVMSVMEDRSSNIWITTWGGGLNKLKDGKITVYAPPGNARFSQVLLSTCEARDGSLWVGAEFDGGLSHISGGKFNHYSGRDGLISSGIKVIRQDRHGALWIGTKHGLSILKNGVFTNYYSTNSTLPGDTIRDIYEDHIGTMWIGSEGGLSRWADGKFVTLTTNDGLSDNAINVLHEDQESNFWIGTETGGLNRMRNGHFTSYTTQNGLFSDRVLVVLNDDHGLLWMSCYRGVFRVPVQAFDDLDNHRIEALPCTVFNNADGLESVQCNGVSQPAGWKTRDGRLWFPTTKGIAIAESNIKPNNTSPPVFIWQIMADNKKIPLPEAGVAGVIQAPPGNGELEFDYGAISFSSPERDRFKYKLDGIDTDWNDAGTRRVAHYNNLYPGNYRFTVRACNNDGVWNETGASVAVVLQPHLWQTKLFLTLVSFSAVGIVVGIVRYLSWKKLRQKLAQLEMQHSLEKERARIARDIHDDLGCSLTQITLLSDESEIGGEQGWQANTRKISATAREMARSLEEIVWAINPEHDTLEGLLEYLTQTADEFLEDTPIRSRLNLPPQLPTRVVSADVRHELFFAFKEALNNAVRHARATEIEIDFVVELNRFRIVIRDNGSGFDIGSARADGNGLKNMRRRLEGIGGQFEISSQSGKGTTIQMTIPLEEKTS